MPLDSLGCLEDFLSFPQFLHFLFLEIGTLLAPQMLPDGDQVIPGHHVGEQDVVRPCLIQLEGRRRAPDCHHPDSTNLF